MSDSAKKVFGASAERFTPGIGDKWSGLMLQGFGKTPAPKVPYPTMSQEKEREFYLMLKESVLRIVFDGQHPQEKIFQEAMAMARDVRQQLGGITKDVLDAPILFDMMMPLSPEFDLSMQEWTDAIARTIRRWLRYA